MKKLIILLLFLLISEFNFLNAQTYSIESLQQTYWNYRDQFRKNYIHIGIENGKSIPYEGLQLDFHVKPLNFDGNHPIINGLINYGDACIIQGWYLAVLATEYRLLITAKTIDFNKIIISSELLKTHLS